ncbi:GCN5-related N-acetyltransferase [Desulfosarcina variabilis str. Montpellier]|uniref:GNAT family N-acetyltransferase n=1 Tax=Desulfosarcina variabilis TaxID=2300 RepID=UPI003AFB4BCA
MEIRQYTDKDWREVEEIYNLSKPDEMRGSVDLQALIRLQEDPNMIKLFQDSEIIVMEENDKIIGFAGNKGNYISWLFVHPNHRRKNVARALLNKMLSTLKGSIVLNVAQNNEAANNLYKSLGFRIEKKFIGNFNGFESKAMTLKLEIRNPAGRWQKSQ